MISSFIQQLDKVIYTPVFRIPDSTIQWLKQDKKQPTGRRSAAAGEQAAPAGSSTLAAAQQPSTERRGRVVGRPISCQYI